jgi:hypothetical protein
MMSTKGPWRKLLEVVASQGKQLVLLLLAEMEMPPSQESFLPASQGQKLLLLLLAEMEMPARQPKGNDKLFI